MLDRLQINFLDHPRLRLVRQQEASECGLACLCMLANYWGCRMDLASLRQRVSMSRRGATLKMLVAAARTIGLESRALRLELDALRTIDTPLVLYWGFDHFVVAKKGGKKGLTILDPSAGETRIAWENVSKKFTGIALELTPAENFEPVKEEQHVSLTSLMGKTRGLKRSLSMHLAMGLLLQFFALLTPLYTQWVLDEVMPAKDRDLLNLLAISFVVLALVSALTTAARSWIATTFSARFGLQWADRVFVHLLDLPMSFFEKRSTGDIIGKFSALGRIQAAVTTQLVGGVIDAVLMLITLGAMLLYSPPLTLFSLVVTVLYFAVRSATHEANNKAAHDQVNASARQDNAFLETLRGIQSIKLYGAADLRRSTWLDAVINQTNAGLRSSRLGILQEFNVNLLMRIASIVAVWYASGLILNNRMTIGMLTVFVSYQDQFLGRTTSLISKLFDYRTLRIHRQRLADIVLSEVEQDGADTFDTEKVVGACELTNVSYAYSTQEKPVLHGINLVVPEGACLAITGASGGGKTTLLKLLLGLLPAQTGEIKFGGYNVNAIGLKNYRKMIGTVMQDDTLFAGSISQNITWFDVDADMDRVTEAARDAAIHDDIMAMPMGYDTSIGDMGTGLSGGQKQRLMIARALYRKPKLLIMDEATSHLDLANEAKVNASIKRLGITRIIVAHRRDTIAMADQVIKLENGTLHAVSPGDTGTLHSSLETVN